MTDWGHYVEYRCEDCGVSITGQTGDPQAAPHLNCPHCGEELDYEVDW